MLRPYFRFHHRFNDAKAEIFICSLCKVDEKGDEKKTRTLMIEESKIKKDVKWKRAKKQQKRNKIFSLSKNKQKEKKTSGKRRTGRSGRKIKIQNFSSSRV